MAADALATQRARTSAAMILIHTISARYTPLKRRHFQCCSPAIYTCIFLYNATVSDCQIHTGLCVSTCVEYCLLKPVVCFAGLVQLQHRYTHPVDTWKWFCYIKHDMCRSAFPGTVILESLLHRQHYSDVMMSVMGSQITSVSIVYSIVSPGGDQRKHQSSAWPRHWPLWGEFTGARWIPRTKDSDAGNVSIWYVIMKPLQLIRRSVTSWGMKSMGSRFSDKLQGLDHMIEYQFSGPSNGHQGDMPYYFIVIPFVHWDYITDITGMALKRHRVPIGPMSDHCIWPLTAEPDSSSDLIPKFRHPMFLKCGPVIGWQLQSWNHLT